MTNNDVLIINGRRYDAVTGQLLVSNNQPRTKTRSMDGVKSTKKSKFIKQPTVRKKLVDPPEPPVPNNKRAGVAHDIILSKTIHAHPTTKPLMRTGLKKPTKIIKSLQQFQSAARSQRPTAEIKLHTDKARMQRAKEMHRLKQVKHFSKHHPSEARSWDVSSSLQAAPSKIIDSVTTQTNKLQNMIDKGLNKALSHEEPETTYVKRNHKTKKSRMKLFNVTIGILAVVLILGFVVYKSIPYVDVRIASAQSGVHAKIPSYLPAGFKFNAPIKYGQGTVTINFTSGTESFRITQQNSSWDSVSLKDSFVNTLGTSYKVVEAGGRIVYLYGQSDATWVNAGIWYQITDNANLGTTTLLKIVTSI